MSVSYPYWSIAMESGVDYGTALEFIETLIPAGANEVFSPVAWTDRIPVDVRLRLIRAFREENKRRRLVTNS